MGGRGNFETCLGVAHGCQKWWAHRQVGAACWTKDGEGEGVMLVLWIAPQTGREDGKSHTWMSIQACRLKNKDFQCCDSDSGDTMSPQSITLSCF